LDELGAAERKDEIAVLPLGWLALFELEDFRGSGAVCVGDFTFGGADDVLFAGERLRVDRFALPLAVGRFQYVADPNPLDERGSIGRSDVYAYVCAKKMFEKCILC
jgi:hypothetical protein